MRAGPLLEQAQKETGARREAAIRDAMKRALDDLIGERLMDLELRSLNVDVGDAEVDLAIEDVKKNNNITDPAVFEQALTSQGFTLATYRDFMKKQLAKVKLLGDAVRSVAASASVAETV